MCWFNSQIENDKIPGAEYPKGNDSEDTEVNKTSTITALFRQILPDSEISEGINSLNSKQREFFNVVHKLAKEYVKCNGYQVKKKHIFLSRNGGTSKYHLVIVIYNAISKNIALSL